MPVSDVKAIVLAGGQSSRLWEPFGRVIPPTAKQFMKFFGKYSLLQNTLRRLHGFVEKENILTTT